MKISPALIMTVFLVFSCSPGKAPAEVRPPVLAGTWYAADHDKLSSDIDELFKNAPSEQLKEPLVLVVPHAGHSYSGSTAAQAYSMVKTMKPGVIVILGTSHYVPVKGCALATADFFETPLGRVPVRRDIVRRLAGKELFSEDRDAHRQEHSIEIQLPLLQKIFADDFARGTAIIPILVGSIDEREAGIIARSLAEVLGDEKNPLVIVSSDFTHYGPRFGYIPFRAMDDAGTLAGLKKLDQGAIDYLLRKDVSGFSRYIDKTGITICGANGIEVALSLPIQGFTAKPIDYSTSFETNGDYQDIVTYVAAALCGKLLVAGAASAGVKWDLPQGDRAMLLQLARQNLASVLAGKKELEVDPSKLPASCLAKRGAFVTLKKGGELRGCIGYIEAEMPLYRTVLENALNAAFRDPRFSRVEKNELPGLTIEISVLTEPVQVASVSEILPGRDGLIIERGTYRGLLLPQVATEYGWDRDTFLDQTCQKAGLYLGAWKESGTKIYRFEAIVFGEK